MRTLILIVICILLWIFVCQNTSCTNEPGARKVLEQNGYTDVRLTGYKAWCCGDEDWYSTGFKATNPSGNKVTGCVCQGVTKGATIRFE